MVVVNFVIPLLFVTASAPLRQGYEWLSDRLDQDSMARWAAGEATPHGSG